MSTQNNRDIGVVTQVQDQQGSESKSKEDSKSKTRESEVTYEALRLNTTGVSKDSRSKVPKSDLPDLGLSKEMTLVDS